MNAMVISANKGLFNESAEMNVIGAFMINSRTLTQLNALDEHDFFDEDRRAIFKAIRHLALAKKPVDILTVDEALVSVGKNITDKIVDCSRLVVSTANIQAYIDIIKDLSTRRKALEISERITMLLLDPMTDTEIVIEDARNALRDMVQSKCTWTEMQDLLIAGYDDLSRRCSGAIKPICSGVRDIDRIIGGFFAGELTLIGARPGVGKSAFGLTIAISAAKAGLNVCFHSLEMSDVQFWQRVISSDSGVDGMRIRTAKLEDRDWSDISNSMCTLSEIPISFLFKTNKIEDLKVEVQKKADSGQIDMLIVDYLQLMQTRKRFDQERLRVGYISATLKQISLEYNIPVIALSQVKRKDGGGRPVMSDLRESGNLEQDADGIILMHRPEQSDDNAIVPCDRSLFESLKEGGCGLQYILFDVCKQRQGATGAVPAIFNPARMTYRCIERNQP